MKTCLLYEVCSHVLAFATLPPPYNNAELFIGVSPIHTFGRTFALCKNPHVDVGEREIEGTIKDLKDTFFYIILPNNQKTTKHFIPELKVTSTQSLVTNWTLFAESVFSGGDSVSSSLRKARSEAGRLLFNCEEQHECRFKSHAC